jgi:hypothetical protein
MYHAIGALLILVGLIVLIKYIMRTGENKKSCSVEANNNYPSDAEQLDKDDEIAESDDIEIDFKSEKESGTGK